MLCPVCRRRSARRPCPALGRDICPVCCGTKRLVEINCPADCGYLASSQAHPAAAVRKQQERDLLQVTALLDGLSRRQKELAWTALGFVATTARDPLLRVRDEDVVEMAQSYASTLRTAQRGVIYEHRPQSLVAQRLVTDLRAFLEPQGAEPPGRGFHEDLASVLERIARGFREAPRLTGEAGPTVCLDAVGRMLRAAGAADRTESRADGAAPSPAEPRLIQLG